MIDFDAPLSTIALPEGSQFIPAEGSILMTDPEAQIRLSHSTNSLMRACERKFQKTKILVSRAPREETPATTFGKAYGAAAQHYMVLRTEGESAQTAIDSAIYECFLNYAPILEDNRRFLERAIHAIQLAQPFHERMLMEWEIAEFNGRPATELSFRLNINKRYYFVGYLDLVLRNRKTRRYAPTDYKSTVLNGEDLSPYFKFSDQVLGYSIILDAIVGAQLSEFDCNYWVCQLANTGKATMWDINFQDYSFAKNLKDRFEWFLKLYMDVNYLETLEQLSVYPRRNSCKSYGTVCRFFGECQFTETDRVAAYEPDTTEYDFTFDLNTLFADHQQRLGILAHA